MNRVPPIRIRRANGAPVRPDGQYVLYWMIANRRLRHNFSLDRALEHCEELHKPLLVFEALRADYPRASDRLHRFVLDGMADNARGCAAASIAYFPYVEPRSRAGKGLLAALAVQACVVITDDFPCFFLPEMVKSAATQVPVLVEAVDSNGLLPLRGADRAFQRAFDFRRFLQKELPKHLEDFPRADPLHKSKLPRLAIPENILAKWPMAAPQWLSREADSLRGLPIDHNVKPAAQRGGMQAAVSRMRSFLDERLCQYAASRNDPDDDVTSGLSPYLHFGQLSAHELFVEIARREHWRPEKLSLRNNGTRNGWWNMSPDAETFLDQLITWRELGYNFAAHRQGYEHYSSLPDWAQKTLQKHARDQREHVYTLEQFESASSHDALWNAAQTQLAREGRIHNYLRMLWGKKILEWTRTPAEALEIMIHLNNKYALDGRDPSSYSGIFWILGRYDRPWGPERPVFGTIRYMSSANTARKISVTKYLPKYGVPASMQVKSR